MLTSLSSPAREKPWTFHGGLIFLSIYLSVLALIALFVFTAGGHMSGLLFVFPALPWPLLGKWLFGFSGFEIGVWVGLVINAAFSFVLGRALSRLKRRLRAAKR